MVSKHKKAKKPEFWPDSLSFEKYSYPAAASIKENEDLLESILDFGKENRSKKKQVTNEGLKKQEEESSSQHSDKKQEQDMEEEIPEDKKREKYKNKRKTEHFLDNSDDESQKKVKSRKNVSQVLMRRLAMKI